MASDGGGAPKDLIHMLRPTLLRRGCARVMLRCLTESCQNTSPIKSKWSRKEPLVICLGTPPLPPDQGVHVTITLGALTTSSLFIAGHMQTQ